MDSINPDLEIFEHRCLECNDIIESTNSARQLCGKTFCYNESNLEIEDNSNIIDIFSTENTDNNTEDNTDDNTELTENTDENTEHIDENTDENTELTENTDENTDTINSSLFMNQIELNNDNNIDKKSVKRKLENIKKIVIKSYVELKQLIVQLDLEDTEDDTEDDTEEDTDTDTDINFDYLLSNNKKIKLI